MMKDNRKDIEQYLTDRFAGYSINLMNDRILVWMGEEVCYNRKTMYVNGILIKSILSNYFLIEIEKIVFYISPYSTSPWYIMNFNYEQHIGYII